MVAIQGSIGAEVLKKAKLITRIKKALRKCLKERHGVDYGDDLIHSLTKAVMEVIADDDGE